MEAIFVVTALVLLISVWYRKQKKKMCYFKSSGIPGPSPHFIRGNLKEIGEKGLAECHKQWIEKYGRVVGYYIGCCPFLLVADPDLLKLIQIKNFSEFADRRIIIPGGTLPTPTMIHSLAFSKGRRWVESRSVLSPAFTSGKLRKMFILIENCVEEFMHVLKTSLQSSDIVDVAEAFTHFTMDAIGRTSFGIMTNVQRNQNNPFVADCNMAVSYDLTNSFIRIATYFPEILPVITPLRKLLDHVRYLLKFPSATGVLKSCSEVIAARRSNKEVQKCDLLQLMIDSKVSEEDIGKEEEQEPNYDKIKTNKENINSGTKSKQWHSMTDTEIQANAMLFMLAGHHTTSTCLTYTAFLLSNHKEVQDKLREEVKNIINDNGDVSYENVMNLQYMDQVINESLRLYPPVISFITRESSAEFRYKDLILPKNVAIQAAIAVMHRDPEYWDEPQKFDPDRFSLENKKNIGVFYQPFGVGRRNCVGIRLALLEIKLALAKLILNYQLLPSSTEGLKVDYKVSVTSPKGGVKLRLLPVSA